ncbi:MAG: tyrosine-type recombinase/integrase [Candidatus Bathyarchaeota archaeon]|nr:tyrosine-type recombinase/integrase [Candidatus Bathyarchaeota archaeon]
MEHQAQTAIVCPECLSEKFFRDGKRKLANGETTQRYICRECGYRYTLPTSLNAVLDNSESSQISALKVKNLASAQETKTCARDAQLPPDAAGLIAQFLAYLDKEGFAKETEYPNLIRRLARLGANLRDPENVKEFIGKMTVKNGMKMQYAYAYNAVATMLKIEWDQPKYKQEEIIPFIPDETELDALINAAKSKRLATYLQTLKETYGDPSEALRIEWIDINEKEQTIKINHPVKGHLPRTLQVSSRLLSMLSCLPHDSARVFNVKYDGISATYAKLKKRLAQTQQNPRLLAIELRTFRHWGGTQVAWHTNGNVLLVKKLLGHKKIENSMKYIGMINFKADDFETTSATTVEDILKLGQAGWVEYSVVKINSAEFHCFRKSKRFANYV